MLPPTVLDDVGPTCWPCLHGPLCIRKGVPGLTIAYLFPNMVSSCYTRLKILARSCKILHDLGRSWQGLGRTLILARSCQDITNILPRLFNLGILAKILPRLSEILVKILPRSFVIFLHTYFLLGCIFQPS